MDVQPPIDDPTAPQTSLLVFADDWGRHPSSPQHLVRQLAGRHRVGWVNTIGTRPPRFDRKTARRVLEKLHDWRGGPPPGAADGAAGPEVLSPRMWPWFRRRTDRAINRVLLHRALRPWVDRSAGSVVAVTTLPIVADLFGILPVDRRIYYCVDDFSAWPGLDAEPLQVMEADLLPRVDRIVAVSEVLRDRLSKQHPDVHLLTHGVDLDHWRGGNATDPLGKYPRPHVVFWGLIDRRLDAAFLEQISGDLADGSILLVGPEDHPDPALGRLPNLHRLGPVPYEQLPAIARGADVLVMPYADLPVTRMMQPLKLLEYLATGCPVVVRALPATGAWRDCLDEVETAADFSRLVRERTASGLPAPQREARRRLSQESWPAKAQEFERMILE